MERKTDADIITDYWLRERAVGERAVATAQRQLDKIHNDGQLKIDYQPGLPDNVVFVSFRKDEPEPLVA